MSVFQPGKHLIQNNQENQTVLCARSDSYKYRQDQASDTILIFKKCTYKLFMHRFH